MKSKKNRISGDAYRARGLSLVEGLEGRQLLSATALPHQRQHHLAQAVTTANATANHTFELKMHAGTNRAMASAGPVGLAPATVRHAYGLDGISLSGITGDGSGQTIAIVDAYNSPNIAADLHTFDQTFSLSDPVLTIEGQSGSTSSLPGLDPSGKGNSWEVETSLDVEWAHAVAPAANILLVEANSTYTTDLFAAVNTARNTAGVSVVSMSWGGAEYSGDTANDTYMTTPAGHQGVTFVASSGDYGAYSSPSSSTMAVEYPAASSNVVAVGGTRLSVDSTGNYLSETAWGSGTTSNANGGAGGGISHYTTQPTYQNGIVTQTSTARAVPDVAFLADPASGVAVIDSYDFGNAAPWLQVGGTSLAAPMWAGVFAIANQGRVLNGLGTLDGKSQTLPDLYAMPSSNFHDITSGNNGYAAAPGYDLVTGRGTPVVNAVVGALAGTSTNPPPTSGTPSVGSVTFSSNPITSGSNVTMYANNVAETGGTISSVNFYEETNGTAGLQAGSDALVGAATQGANGTWSLTAGTSGVTPGNYTIYAVATDAAGVNSAAASGVLRITSSAPANDNFANATKVTRGTSTAGTNVNATRQAGEPYIINNTGGHSVWYVWTATTSGRVNINTHGSNFDTLLGVYTGTAVNALKRIASNDDDPGYYTTTSSVTFNAVAGQTYRIAVDGYNGANGNIVLNIA